MDDVSIVSYQDLKQTELVNTSTLTLTENDPNSVPYIDSNQTLQDYVLTNGQLLIGATNGPPLPNTITAVANQTTVTNGPGTITIGVIQNIGPTSNPTFNSVTISGLTPSELVATNASDVLESVTISNANGTNLSFATNILSASMTQNLGTGGSPSFTALTVSGLTATELVATNASKVLESVGITNSNGTNLSFSGSTLASSMTQNLGTGGSPSFTGLTVSGLTASELVATNASDVLQSVSISNSNGNNVSFSGSTLTASLSQNLGTTGTPSFTSLTLSGLTASELVATNASDVLQSVTISNANGTNLSFATNILSASMTQNLATTGTPSFSTLTLTGGTLAAAMRIGAGGLVQGVALTNGQLLIGSVGVVPVAANITGTAGQINVTNGAGSITLSIPSALSITNLTLTGITANSVVLTNSSSQLVPATFSSATGVTLTSTAGALVINTPQNLQTTANPTFNNLTVTSLVNNHASYWSGACLTTIPSGTFTTLGVLITANIEDPSGMFVSSASSSWTVPVTGKYWVQVYIRLADQAVVGGDSVGVTLLVNAVGITEQSFSFPDGGGRRVASLATLLQITSGGVVTIQAFQTSGSYDWSELGQL